MLVRSKASDGKIAPRAKSEPRKAPKKPRGMPKTAEISEKAELSQLKKALMSQNEPAKSAP